MEHVTLTWSFENIITIWLMVALGVVGIGLVSTIIRNRPAS